MVDSDNRPIAISHLRTRMGLGILHNCPTYLLSWIESAIDVLQYELLIKTLPNTDKYNLIRKCHLSFWESIGNQAGHDPELGPYVASIGLDISISFRWTLTFRYRLCIVWPNRNFGKQTAANLAQSDMKTDHSSLLADTGLSEIEIDRLGLHFPERDIEKLVPKHPGGWFSQSEKSRYFYVAQHMGTLPPYIRE